MTNSRGEPGHHETGPRFLTSAGTGRDPDEERVQDHPDYPERPERPSAPSTPSAPMRAICTGMAGGITPSAAKVTATTTPAEVTTPPVEANPRRGPSR